MRKLNILLFLLLLVLSLFIFYYLLALRYIRRLEFRVEGLLKTPLVVIDKHKLIYVPSEGGIQIKTKGGKRLEEVAEVRVKNIGFVFRPGVQVSIPVSYGIDSKVFFWNRLGLNLGFIYTNPIFYPTVSISYKLDRLRILVNTEVFIGQQILNPLGLYVGLRINL